MQGVTVSLDPLHAHHPTQSLDVSGASACALPPWTLMDSDGTTWRRSGVGVVPRGTTLYCKIDHEARDKILEVVIHLCMAPDEGGKNTRSELKRVVCGSSSTSVDSLSR
jgi:hypothetical protein